MMHISSRQDYLKFYLRHKYRIAFTYLATVVGSIFVFLYPYATGVAIDGALKHDISALLPLASIWIAHLAVDGFRQIYDTRTFTRVFADAATEMVVSQKVSSQNTSEIAARVNMMEDLTWFLGASLPELLISLITPIGGLLVLFALSPRIAWATLGLAVLALFFNAWLFPKLKDRQTEINSLREMSVGQIEVGIRENVSQHYSNIGKAFVRVSDLSAISWIAVQAMAIGVVAFGIWSVGTIPQITTGEAYSLVAYIWRVLDGVYVIPNFAHQFARLIDIWRRIAHD